MTRESGPDASIIMLAAGLVSTVVAVVMLQSDVDALRRDVRQLQQVVDRTPATAVERVAGDAPPRPKRLAPAIVLHAVGARRGRAVLVTGGSAHQDNSNSLDGAQKTEARMPTAAPSGDIYDRAIHYIHYHESRRGQDPNCKRGIVGPAGERGEWQVTPIFVADCRRLFGETVDPYDEAQCRRLIPQWLRHYRPNATSMDELYRCYQYGPTGAE